MKTSIYSLTLLIASISVSAQQLIHQKVYSKKMEKTIETVVITPNLQKGKTYNSVYILHGYSGNPDRTYQKDIPNLRQLAEKYQTIYIIPDGAYNSWYVDSPKDPSSQYQTFVGEELVLFIDAHYPTKNQSKNRGISGWSMGGYGAVNIGIAYTNTFSVVGSSCGALDFNRFGLSYNNYQVDRVLGSFKSLPQTYLTFSKIKQMQTANQWYLLDCGTEDTQMIEMNRDFHQLLTGQQIPHLYIETIGTHHPDYWSQAMSNQLALFDKYWNP